MLRKRNAIFKKVTAFSLLVVMLATSSMSAFAEENVKVTDTNSKVSAANADDENTARDPPSEDETEDDELYSVYVMDTENGTVYVNGETEEVEVESGETVTVTYEADEGYELSSISFLNDDAEEVEATFSNDKYTFEMPQSDIAIIAEFCNDDSEVSKNSINLSQNYDTALASTTSGTISKINAKVGTIINGSESWSESVLGADGSVAFCADPNVNVIVGNATRGSLEGWTYKNYTITRSDILFIVAVYYYGIVDTSSQPNTYSYNNAYLLTQCVIWRYLNTKFNYCSSNITANVSNGDALINYLYAKGTANQSNPQIIPTYAYIYTNSGQPVIKIAAEKRTNVQITIHKTDANGNALSRAEFTVYGYDKATGGYTSAIETKTTDSEGIVVFSSLTDSEGYEKTGNGLFLVKETKTPDGYSASETYLNDDDKADFEKYGGRLYYIKATGGNCVAYRDTTALTILAEIGNGRLVSDHSTGYIVKDAFNLSTDVAASDNVKTYFYSDSKSSTEAAATQMGQSTYGNWFRSQVLLRDYATTSTDFNVTLSNCCALTYKDSTALVALGPGTDDIGYIYNQVWSWTTSDGKAQAVLFKQMRDGTYKLRICNKSSDSLTITPYIWTNDEDRSDIKGLNWTIAAGGSNDYDFSDKDFDDVARLMMHVYINDAFADKSYIQTMEYKDSIIVNDEDTTSSLLKLQKVSSNPSLTDGNNCYSLKDAKYGVYKSAADAAEAVSTGGETGKELKILVSTDEDGSFEAVEMDTGIYYITELEAPKGYQKDSTVYTVNLTGDTEVTTFSVKEVPATDPVGIQVYKIDSKTGEQSTRYGGTFENAEFTIKYYDAYYTSLSAVGDDTATRTWVYKTDEDGYLLVSNPDLKVSGDELYIVNNKARIPYGTLVIRETKAPYGYEASNETWIVTFTEGSDGKVVRTFYNGNGEKLDATSKIDVGSETTPGTAAISETVADPEISTTALDRTTGLHEGNWQAGDIAIIDTVKVDKIVPGQTYTIKGVLMDKETGESLKDENDDEIIEEYTFTADSESATQTLTFEISDEDTVKTKEIVVFEELYGPDEDVTGEMVLRASHKDLDDADQTVIYPEIQTVALNDAKSHIGNADTSNNIIDTVTYEGVIPGNTYTVKGTLYDKSTETQITDEDGTPITSETTFTAQSAEGEVIVNFSNIGYSTLAGKSVVVYEKLYSQNVLLYSHENIKDADQTVTYLDNCAIKIIKYDKNGSTLQGVKYKLSDSSGNIVQEGTTDENGEISFEKLPSGTYQLVETKTADGLSLLKDTITIEIPNAVSVEDAKKMGIDEDTDGVVYLPENNEEKAHYLICKVTCEIRDDATFVLPQTGSNGTWNIGLIALGILACTISLVYLKSRKRDNI